MFSILCEFSVPPHLKGDGMYDITIKKGRPIRYDLWFGGEPAPSVEWLRDGRTLSADENTSIELYAKNSIYTERNTVLNIPKVMQTFAARILLRWSFRPECGPAKICSHPNLSDKLCYLKGHPHGASFRDKFRRHELEGDIYRCPSLVHVSEICL